jgi:streptogramin lyase
MNNHFMTPHSTPDPVCAEFETTLALLPLGELNTDEETTARAHAATCVRCQRRLAEYDLVYSSLRHASSTPVISRPLFTVDDIILSALLSDDFDEDSDEDSDEDEGISTLTFSTTPPTRPFAHLLTRRATMLSGMGALAAVLLFALLTSTLFHLRGSPNATTRIVNGGGTWTEYSLPANGKVPGHIVAGPDGNIWFTDHGMIGRITPDGVVTEFPLPVAADAVPTWLTRGPGKSLLVVVNDEILRVSMNGTVTRVPLPASYHLPIGSVLTAPDGTIWFAVPSNLMMPAYSTNVPMIGRISPQGSLTTYDTSRSLLGNDIGIIGALPDGSLWIYSESALGRINPDGKITAYDASSLNGLVSSGTVDADGNLWVVGGFNDNWNDCTYDHGKPGGDVVRIAPNGTTKVWSFSATLKCRSGVEIITIMGRDGNLWTSGIGVILRTAQDGTVTTFDMPSDFIVNDMAVDANNDLWVTENGTNKIGHIHLGT